MAKVPLIAKRSLLYAGRRVASGAEFEARTGQDARLLIAIGHADFAPAGEPDSIPFRADNVSTPADAPVVDVAVSWEHPAPNASPPFDPSPTSEVVAEQPAAEPVADPQPAPPVAETPPVKPRRTYRRRDLTAEGSE